MRVSKGRVRRPKLGQHFLADESFRRRIAESAAILPSDLVIEIGPGGGAMTGLLAQRARRVVAIEIDPGLAARLRDELAGVPNLEIVEADILAIDLAEICRRAEADRCFVFGNLPYYITSPILRHLLDSRRAIRAMALMVQREVAQRLVAFPGTRDYGYLTVFTQLHSSPGLLMRIPPGAFSPPPRVESALVGFEMHERLAGWDDKELGRLEDFLKRSFAQKRKTLANNLGPGSAGRARAERALGACGLPRATRAEQLTIEQFGAVFRRLESETESGKSELSNVKD